MAEYVVVDKEQLESDLGIVCDAIREKGGTSEPLSFPNGMKEAVRGIQSGDTSKFGESYWIENLNGKTNTSYLFYEWKGEKVPFFDTSKSTSFQYMFAKANITEIPDYDMSNVVSFFAAFQNTTNLKSLPILNVQKANRIDSMISGSGIESVEIKNTGNVTNIGSFANGCKALKSIKTLDLTSATNVTNIFLNCTSLEEVRFVPSTIKLSINITPSSNLSDESIQSIIDGLATVETTQTLTLHANVKAKLTDEQKTQITSKNWTLA